MKSKRFTLPRLHHLLAVVLVLLIFVWGLGFDAQTPGAAEKIFYLASLGATTFPTTLPSPAPYGQINLACRTGWRYIEPASPTVGATPNWSTIDSCQTAAHAITGEKWSLSIKIGADTPLWLYDNSCLATPVAGEGTPGHGTLQAFNFNWQVANQPYTVGSTQCLPLPWGTNYLSQLNTFIQAVATHIGTDSSLDHVVVTGINSTTQENMQPNCSPASTATPYTCGIDGVHSDIDNWVSIIQPGHPSCTATSCAVYNELLLGGPGIPNAYATIIGYWGSAFPSSVKLASMFVNSGVKSFPFNTTTDLGLGLLNDVVSYNSSRSIVMNNAANMTPTGTSSPSPDLANPILCYKGSETPGFTCQTPAPQPTSVIAFQEDQSLVFEGFNCSVLTTFLGDASTDKSVFMETYPLDINTCF